MKLINEDFVFKNYKSTLLNFLHLIINTLFRLKSCNVS